MREKPPHGAPCNRCGDCCRDQLCPLGASLFDEARGPCPALERDGDRYACGLMASPRRYAPVRTARFGAKVMRNAAALLIGAGHGCDALVDGETPDEAWRARVREVLEAEAERANAAIALWGVA